MDNFTALVMQQIQVFGPISLDDLATKLDHSKSPLSYLVSTLRDLGLVHAEDGQRLEGARGRAPKFFTLTVLGGHVLNGLLGQSALANNSSVGPSE